MSNRIVERVTAAVMTTVNVVLGDINIKKWGGVDVAPAAPKTDGEANSANVPEIGSRLETFNEDPVNGWDMVRSGFTSVRTVVRGWINTIPYAIFNEDGVSLVDQDKAPLQLDKDGNLKVTGSGTSNTNVVEWGGVAVAPAAAKADGQASTDVVPETGARLEGFNGAAGVGSWDLVRVGLTAVTTTFKGFLNNIPYGKFNVAGITLVDGDGATLQLDSTGALRVTGTATTTPQVVGTQNNAWAAVLTGAGGVSASIDCRYTPFVTAFGSTSATTKITLQVSQDNITFTDAVTDVVPSGGDFEMARTVGARYVRLKSSANVTASATIAAKD